MVSTKALCCEYMSEMYCKETGNVIRLLGVEIDAVSVDELLREIQLCVSEQRRIYLAYINTHGMNISYSTPWFRNFLNQSYLTFCDGVGIKLAAKMTNQSLMYRFTPPDFMENICETAAALGWRLFFLGAKPDVVEKAAQMILYTYPNLQIKTHHGYFEKSLASMENQAVISEINHFQPHILILGFGMPMQEKWILENFESLDINIAFPAGALFDYLSGSVKRAPRWMTDNGLEWLGRLVIEPRRLWKRYIIGNPLFFWRIFIHHILRVPLPG